MILLNPHSSSFLSHCMYEEMGSVTHLRSQLVSGEQKVTCWERLSATPGSVFQAECEKAAVPFMKHPK